MIFNKTHSSVKTFFCLVLSFLLILSAVSCSPATGNENTSADNTTAEETTEASKAFEFNTEAVIVRPDKDNAEEIAALQLVNRCIGSIYGKKLSCVTDFVKNGQEIQPAEYEILIGGTNRADSVDAVAGLDGTCGVYKIVSENVIVIAGGSPAATLKAAVAFCEEIFGYRDDVESEAHTVLSAGNKASLLPGTEGVVTVDFPILTLNGTDIKNYSIVTELSDKGITGFATKILECYGGKLPILTPDQYEGGPAFFLGYTDGEPTGHKDEVFDGYSFYVTFSGNKISVDWKKSTDSTSVLNSFLSEIIPADTSKDVNLSFGDGTARLYTLSGEHNLLRAETSKTQSLAQGINYIETLYKDRNGNDVKVLAVTIEKGAGRLYAGLPDDAPSEVSGKTATVMNAMTAAAANGKNIIAGFNSGFFDLGGTGLSRGLVVKEGVEVAPNTDRPFIAQLNDGSVKLLTASQYSQYKNQINTALAGNIIIMQGGRITSIAKGTDMAVTRHPRTAAGYNAETGEIVIVEVDGRQPSFSNGASYLDLVTIFRDLGCTELINLDGGGSSTCIIKDSSGSFKLKNSPSDKSMRKVQDSILVIAG